MFMISGHLFAGDWVITIRGIYKEKEGNLLLAVYPGEEGYLDLSQIVYAEKVPVTSEEMQFAVNGLPPGEYSFAILHDEDGDDEMKKGAIMPKEGFAFSGAKQPAGKPPKYKNAYITLGTEAVYSTAIMKYY